jgi:hypothetical protein
MSAGRIVESENALWQPFVDEPLFVPELALGLTAVPAQTRERMRTYLAALLQRRRAPLHAAVGWNALHFGYDLRRGGYVGELLNGDAFPILDSTPKDYVLPAGAMVRLPAGQTPVWGEVMHIDQEHPDIDPDGYVPPRLSGAPALDLADVDGLVHLRLVVDTGAFGPLFPEQRNALLRLRNRGVLDTLGHLATTVPADACAEDLDADEPGAYARYLVIRRRGLLVGGPLGLGLDASDDGTLFEAVLRSLHAVRDLLAGLPSVKMWHHNAVTDGADASPDPADVAGPRDLADLASRVRSAHPGQTRHTAVGSALRGLAATAPAADAFAALGETRYLGALVTTHLMLAATSEAQGGDGRLPSGVHLRLDDDRLGGGVWRAEGRGVPAGPHAGIHPLVPLGLGYCNAVGSSAVASDMLAGVKPPAGQPPTVEPPPQPVDEAVLVDVTASHLVFRVALRPAHLAEGVLRLPDKVADELATDTARDVGLRLVHDGEELDEAEATQFPLALVDTPARALRGVQWPLAFHPGIRISCVLARGGSVVDATTERLDDPLEVNGHLIVHATDLAVLLAFLGLGERSSTGERRDLGGLAELLLRALRRAGQPGPGGSRRATAPALAATVYAGLPAPADAALRAAQALNALVDTGRLQRLAGARHADPAGRFIDIDPDTYVWSPSGVVPVERPRADAPPSARLDSAVRRHTVPIFIRHLPPGWQPNPEKLEAWPQVRASLGPDCLLPDQLPDGCTWVHAHERGTEVPLEHVAVRVGG